jgi:hypothetical protein
MEERERRRVRDQEFWERRMELEHIRAMTYRKLGLKIPEEEFPRSRVCNHHQRQEPRARTSRNTEADKCRIGEEFKNNNNNTFTWSGPSGVLGFTGQRPVGHGGGGASQYPNDR